MKLNLTAFALTALLTLGVGVVHAQDDEPAAEKAAPAGAESDDNTATAADKAAARAARIARRRARIAARRAAMARTDAIVPSPAEPAVAPQPEAVPPPVEHAAPIDTKPAETPVDALPAIAPVKETPSPEHEGAAAEPGHAGSAEPSVGHGAAVQGAAHESHGEGHGSPGAHGAEHGEHAGFSVGTFALQLLNFGVLLFLLIWFGGRAMNKSLRARHEQLKGDINEAARLRDEAEKKFQSQEQRVTDLEKEIAALRTSLRQDAEREQVRLIEGAQKRAKRIQEDMRLQMNQQVKEAESLLRAEVASASVKLAEELVRKSMNTDDERRLAQEFVAGFDVPAGPQGTVG